jgi:tRNA-modifying protein YgfZ
MDGYRLIRESAGTVALPDVALVELSGSDALEWLQGQVTNDVRPLAKGQPVSFCLCSPTGQIQSVIDSFPLNGDRGVLLSMPASTLHHVLNRIEQMVIMEDVIGRDLTGEYTLLSVQGPLAADALDDRVREECIVVPNDRTGSGGFDVWSKRDAAWVPEALSTRAPLVDESAYLVTRLEAGIPLMGQDISEKTLPPELGPAFEAKHVSYTKGCYVGQEILQRIHSRGHTNKTWMGLTCDQPMQVGDRVQHATRSDAGYITSVGQSPVLGYIAGAVLRNEAAEPGQSVTVGEASAKVSQMPLLGLDG